MNIKWHSDLWPTVTSQPIRLSTNSLTLIQKLTFIELWVVSMEHFQWVWLASRERLLFWTPGSVPIFGTYSCSKCWDQIRRICHVFARLFTYKTTWYFLDFALSSKSSHYIMAWVDTTVWYIVTCEVVELVAFKVQTGKENKTWLFSSENLYDFECNQQ